MSAAALKTAGLKIFIDGTGPNNVLMLHGWPDTHRLWDGTVAALQDRFRCVRFTLPGFDLSRRPRATSVDEMTALLRQVVDAVSPELPVTLLLHDWGCVFGYEFAARHPERVARIVAVDIGDHNSPALGRALNARARWQVFGYQFWLALAWKIGGTIGTRMTQWMARSLRCKTDPAQIGWQMNYPYAMRWFGSFGGLKTLPVQPHCPLLYLYGTRKPFMFHSPAWLEAQALRPDCAVQGLYSGHWVMIDQPDAFHERVRDWLLAAPRATPLPETS